MGAKMPSSDYNKFLSAIKYANDMRDSAEAKKQLQAIRASMIEKYGMNNDDVEYLMRQFRYNI
ncbi:MAG: hypothetical protein J6M20_00680 [Clostridia bacterium]|nr:hypothetical protein [Clostridia bacterium]